MSQIVGDLIIQMSADVARLRQDMDHARRTVDSSMQSITRAAGTARAALGALGVGLSFGALVSSLRDAANQLDTIGKMSQRVGVTTEALSGLAYAGKLSDVSMESLANGMKRLSLNMQDAKRGSGEALPSFRALGISVTDTAGRLKSSDQVLREIADRFQMMPDGANKTAHAMRLLGKSGADMIPMLNGGSSGLKEMTDEAERFGLIVAPNAAKQAEIFNDNLTRLGQAFDGLKIAVANSALPAINDWVTANIEAMRIAGSFKEFLRLFVFDLNAMTSEKPREEIDRLTGELQELESQLRKMGDAKYSLGLSPDGKGLRFASTEAIKEAIADLQKQIQFLEVLDRQLQSRVAAPRGRTGQALENAGTPAAGGGGGGSPTAKTLSEYDRLIKSIKEKIAAEELEAAGIANLNAAEKDYAKFLTDVREGYIKLTPEQMKNAAVVFDAYIKQSKANEAERETKKLHEERRKIMQSLTAEEAKRALSLQDESKSLREQLETLGMTSEELAAYRAAKMDAAAANELFAASELESAAAILDMQGALPEVVDWYLKLAKAKRETAAALSDQSGLTRDIERRNQEIQQVEEYGRATANVWQDIERTAHDTFISIFDSGKDVFERLTDTLKNTLLELLYQMTVKKWLINISAGVSGQGVAQQAFGMNGTGGGGSLGVSPLLSYIGNMGGVGAGFSSVMSETMLGSQFVGPSATLANGSVGMGAQLPGIVGGALSSYGLAQRYGPIGGFVGGVGSTALMGGASTMMAGGSFMAGASAALSAIPVWGWIAMAIAAILGGGKGGTPHAGGIAFGSEDGFTTPSTMTGIRGMFPAESQQASGGTVNRIFGESDWTRRFDQGVADALGPIAQTSSVLLNRVLSAYGLGDGYQVGLAFSADGEDKSRGRFGIVSPDGELIGGYRGRYDKDADDGMKEFGVDVLRRMLVSLRDDFDLGDMPKDYLANLNIGGLSSEQAASAFDTLEAFTRISAAAEKLGMDLDALVMGLANSSGNVDAFVQAQATLWEALATDPFEAYAQAAEEAGRSLMGTWSIQGDAIRELIADYDGGLASTQALASATAQRYQTELALAQQLAQAMQSTVAMFEGSARTIKLDMLDNEGKYAFFDEEAARYRDVLATLTDPSAISEYAGKLNQSIMDAWALLDEEQRKASGDQFLQLLEDADALAADRYKAAEDEIRTDREAMASAIEDAIVRAMQQASTDIGNAVPDRISVQVTVSDDRSSAEVTPFSGGL